MVFHYNKKDFLRAISSCTQLIHDLPENEITTLHKHLTDCYFAAEKGNPKELIYYKNKAENIIKKYTSEEIDLDLLRSLTVRISLKKTLSNKNNS